LLYVFTAVVVVLVYWCIAAANTARSAADAAGTKATTFSGNLNTHESVQDVQMSHIYAALAELKDGQKEIKKELERTPR
jgi:hypothetical protein